MFWNGNTVNEMKNYRKTAPKITQNRITANRSPLLLVSNIVDGMVGRAKQDSVDAFTPNSSPGMYEKVSQVQMWPKTFVCELDSALNVDE